MDQRQYLSQWLRALTVFEHQLMGPIGRNRNAFIKRAADEYIRSTRSSRPICTHLMKIENILVPHYKAVMPYFGQFATQQYKRRRTTSEVKRLTFLLLMQDWIAQRAMKQATTISDTDYDDVQDAISKGVDQGLGIAEIASAISDVTDLTSYRAHRSSNRKPRSVDGKANLAGFHQRRHRRSARELGHLQMSE
jgi:hypothetical protein